MIDFDTTTFSPESKLAARILQFRAQLALGKAREVLKAVSQEDIVDIQAAEHFAQYYAGQSADALKGFEKLAESQSENSTVQLLAGIVFQAVGRTEEALSLLSKHQGSLEA